jgi:Zn-dependent protease/CBS domain-containing protein
MTETLRLGTIAGIRVGVNWSVLLIFTLLLVGLSAGSFPLLYPGHSPAAYWVAGGIAALVFLSSLLAHELAHALVARREGVGVEGITLWVFGGVAKLTGEATTPQADLRIAAVGPLVSIALSIGFGVLAILVTAAGGEGLVPGVLGWLALINAVLAGFNLIPAAPLDGGRILRAVLWRRHGDRVEAAVTASRAGRGFGFLLVVLGLVLVVLTPGLGGLWFALIGWFISSAAGAEEQYARLQGALAEVRVGSVMTPDPVTVGAGVSVQELLDDYVLRHRHSAYPVIGPGDTLDGLVTLDGIRRVPAELRAATDVTQIADGIGDVARARSDERLVEVLPSLRTSRSGRILVVDDDRLVGIVSATDIARALDLAQLVTPDPQLRVRG